MACSDGMSGPCYKHRPQPFSHSAATPALSLFNQLPSFLRLPCPPSTTAPPARPALQCQFQGDCRPPTIRARSCCRCACRKARCSRSPRRRSSSPATTRSCCRSCRQNRAPSRSRRPFTASRATARGRTNWSPARTLCPSPRAR